MFCGKCGTKMGDGDKFCPNCGQASQVSNVTQQTRHGPVVPIASVSGDGFFGKQVREPGDSEKTTKTALILAIAFGFFGGHCFYVGKTQTGIMKIVYTVFGILFPLGFIFRLPILGWLQVVSLLASIIWLAIDVVLIANGEYKDSEDALLHRNY